MSSMSFLAKPGRFCRRKDAERTCYFDRLAVKSRNNISRRSHTDARERRWQSLAILKDPTTNDIRREALQISRPVQFTFTDAESILPATTKWFKPLPPDGNAMDLNYGYFLPHGSSLVPLELTSKDESIFKRAEAPLSLFMEYCKMASTANDATSPSSRFYLAQAPISALPETLRNDLPTPQIVLEAGTGDVYDANVWMGLAPTYTPLHRDPNPNFFIQLAGTKVARIMDPRRGNGVFEDVQRLLKRNGSKSFRGDEMMAGAERGLLENEVWGNSEDVMNDVEEIGFEIVIEAGSGVFIPQGWWHSIKGIGSGITASANWWFR